MSDTKPFLSINPEEPQQPVEEAGVTVSSTADASSEEKLTKQSGQRGWYIIHSNTGYEDQVAQNLRQRIESFGMQDKIFNVIVPKEKEIEIRGGKRRTVEKKIFPSYVMVEMIVTDESWYVVRNTPNVTGFIGLGVRPTPMSQQELDRIRKRMGVEEPKYKIELAEGDLVQIKDGPLKGFEGKVTEVDSDKGRVKVLVSMFGRETPVTLDFLQVSKV
ncbi:MAG TPA: transcription termination/antitermination protein NusG [Patescibacteria group bacterium]